MFDEIKPKRRRSRFDIRNLFCRNGEGDGAASGGGGNTTITHTPPDSTAPKSVSAEFTPPGGPSSDSNSGSLDWGNVVPAEFKEKPYIQNILKNADPGTEFFKQFDGLQKKLGERPAGVPAADASAEDWDKFYDTLKPESADKYEMKPVELGEEQKDIAEFVNQHRDEKFLKSVMDLAHKHKIPKKMFDGFAADYDKLFIEKFSGDFQAGVAAAKQADADFDKLAGEIFGADMDKELESAKKVIGSHISDKAKPYMDKLPNEALIVMADFAKAVRSKYIKEDTLPTGGTGAAGMSKEQLSAEGRKLMAHPAYRNEMHPEHESIKRQVNELYDSMRTKK